MVAEEVGVCAAEFDAGEEGVGGVGGGFARSFCFVVDSTLIIYLTSNYF